MARGLIGAVDAPNIFKVTFRFNLFDSQCQTGFKVRDLALNDNTVQNVLDVFDPWFLTNFRPLLNQADRLVALDVVKMGTEEGLEKIYNGIAGSRINGGTSIPPAFLAANISMKTQLRKRYGQGRMFWPLRDDNLFDGDKLNGAGVAAIQSVVDALLALTTGSVLTHDLRLVNTHGTLPPKAATPSRPARPEIPPSWYDVDTVRVNEPVTALRSRKIGIGA